MKIRFVHVVFLGLALNAAAGALASGGQEPKASPAINHNPERAGRGPWMAGMGQGRGLLGTVTEVTGDHYMVKIESGEIYTVHFSVNTRIMKQPTGRRRPGGDAEGDDPQQFAPQTLKPSEIKVGDAITAGGEMDVAARSVGAVFIMLVDPERAKQLRAAQASYGKTWLMGRVIAVDGVKVTLQSSIDNTTHTFIADENTTFRKRREPITLGDVEVGDVLRTDGAFKDGVFTASSVFVMGAPERDATPSVPRSGPAPMQPR